VKTTGDANGADEVLSIKFSFILVLKEMIGSSMFLVLIRDRTWNSNAGKRI
jgi:hypothetical protein